MKTKLYDMNGKQGKEITLPKAFDSKVRVDIVSKVLEAKKTQQPYAPSPVAGKQHSASGILKHHRKVWKSQYGRGISRIPRKIMTRKGSQFNWVGAEVSNTRGGRRPHPPKILSFFNRLKINKKELRVAFCSALSASADKKFVEKKYASIDKIDREVPFVVESKLTNLKSKELMSSLKKIIGEKLFGVAIQKKEVRSGRGKLRGRKYKSNAGMLLVIGNDEKLKTTAFDVVSVKALGVVDLANGGVGRLTVYTENAIKDLENKFVEKKE
ncbi:MAG: 50S ribosomal protein L4 [Candidatus Pacearchaeota archaeon]|nr:50S ribosomal protein L4 [Candidatus Pacearchaeota archaeon]